MMFTPTCPHCGHILDASSCVSREKGTMSAGDFSICYYCLAILRFYNSPIHVGGLGMMEVYDAPREVLDMRDQLRRFKLVYKAGLN